MTWSRKVRKQARNELQSAATHLYASSSSPCGFLNWNLQTRLSLLNGRIRFSANLLVLICSLITSVITFRSFAWAPALLSEACKGSIPSRYRHGIGTASKKVSQQSLRLNIDGDNINPDDWERGASVWMMNESRALRASFRRIFDFSILIEWVNAHSLPRCGPVAQNGALCLRLFVQSLEGPAFTWHAHLSEESIPTWEARVSEFIKQFSNTQRRVGWSARTTQNQAKG